MTIDLYTWPTPNGHKIHILLEELGLDYNVHAIDIGAGDQFQPDFLAISRTTGFRRWLIRRARTARRCRCSNPGQFCSTWPKSMTNFCPRPGPAAIACCSG